MRSRPDLETTENESERPTLESLVANVSDETKQTLKELFRAEFSEVRRIRKEDLK